MAMLALAQTTQRNHDTRAANDGCIYGGPRTRTKWTYDDLTVGGPKAKGKLTRVVVAAGGYAGATGYEEQYVYDSTYGDLQDARRRIENEWFWISQSYDGQGRVDVIKYPNSVSGSTASSAGPDSERVKARQNYNAYGYLSSVSDPDSGTVYWSAISNDAGGALTREDLGNGLSTLRTVGRASGNLTSLTTGVGVSATVQNLAFEWDGAGNLIRRTDHQANKKEEFDYDGLYRMTQSRLYATAGGTTPSTTDNYTFDTIGNLTNKGGTAGAYTYGNYNYGTRTGCADTVVRPHAVYQVTVGAATRRYCYDANGNLTNQSIASGTGSTQYDSATWWVANLAQRIAQNLGSTYSDFWYGPGRERIRQFAQKSATTTENTLYVGGLFEKLTRTVSGTPSTEYVHYLRGGDQAIAVVKRISGSLQTRYLHRDHLGSVVALTDTAGAIVERYSYDPWGKRRDPSTWVTPAPGTFAFDPSYSDRGFTGHEHIDHLGLINMNGRIYDPEIGKFLSADPTTQFPESTQGWNRYTYGGNNPLSYTDPSGFSWLKSVMMVVGIAMSVFAPQFSFLWMKLLWTFASGFMASGGSLQGGLVAMATVGIGAWAGKFARAGPAGAGGTPGFNPNALSLSAKAAEQAADRTTQDKIMEVVRRSIQNRVWDTSERTNSDRKMDNGANTSSYSIMYEGRAYIVSSSAVPSAVGARTGSMRYETTVRPDCSGQVATQSTQCDAIFPSYAIENALLIGAAVPSIVRGAITASASTSHEATGFLGSRGTRGWGLQLSNLDEFQKVRNADALISGRTYSGHALDQMQNRGLMPSVVENTIRTGVPSPDPIIGRVRYYDSVNNVTVITEGQRVVTAIPGRLR